MSTTAVESCTQQTPFEPINDRVVIEPDATETESPGGIVLSAGSTDKPQCGVVVAAGPGAPLENGERFPMQVSVGQRVLFSPYADHVTLDDVEYVLVREGDLYAILH